MAKSEAERVETLSKKVGGRFKLTALVQKRVAEYVKAGKTFMPDVKNLDELFSYVLDEVENGKIELLLPEQTEKLES